MPRLSTDDGCAASSFQQVSQSGVAASGQTIIGNFVMGTAQRDAFVDNFSRLLFESAGSVALSLIENPRVKAMFTSLGITPPSRKWLSTTKLDAVYSESRDEMRQRMGMVGGEASVDSVGFMMAADGWRSKYVEGGQKLINIMVLFPDGGSGFTGVEMVTEHSLDTAALFNILKRGALKAVDGNEAILQDKLLGFVTDAEAVNKAALRKLKECFPRNVLLVCQAHGLALLANDYASKSKVR